MLTDLKPLIRRTVEIDYTHKHRHLGGSLSALPIIAEIFNNALREPAYTDVFILSKGHAAPAYYAVLEAIGFHPDVSLPHPDYDPENGIPCTTGSLGHGLPVAVGYALGFKMNGDNDHGCVHVLLGDGECLEGTTWEALRLAQHLGLKDYLKIYVDCNGWQGSCRTLCEAYYVLASMSAIVFPMKLIDTKRGAGVSLFEKNPDWHTHLITDAEYKQIMEELK